MIEYVQLKAKRRNRNKTRQYKPRKMPDMQETKMVLKAKNVSAG